MENRFEVINVNYIHTSLGKQIVSLEVSDDKGIITQKEEKEIIDLMKSGHVFYLKYFLGTSNMLCSYFHYGTDIFDNQEYIKPYANLDITKQAIK